jgi:diguanylate cyclase (GGDEF)-like protein
MESRIIKKGVDSSTLVPEICLVEGRGGTLRPTLFTCYGHAISEYRLSGRQTVGRPSGDIIPDIPIHARFISREHGSFITEEDDTYYIASNTTNPVKYKGVFLEAGDRVKLRDGDELIVPWTDDEGKDQSVVLVYTNNESRIRMWRNLQKASRDNLTDLIDRDSFVSWWLQNMDKKDYAEAVLFILDVDDFKRINDTAGHNAGDLALRIIADELRNAVRYESQVCRWGGDEFVGIIPSDTADARERLEGIRNGVLEKTAASDVAVSVSIGYVSVQDVDDKKDVVSMVEFADRALYEIKKTGKNKIAMYKKEI